MTGLNDRAKTALALLLAAGLGWRASAQAPDPPWRHADAPLRAIFHAPAGQAFALVEFPAAQVTNGVVSRIAAYHGASPRPVRVAATNAGILTLLVNCQGLAPQAVVAVYAVTNQAPVAPDTAFADPQPVAVSLRKAGANEAPPTWKEMRFMATRPDPQPTSFTLEGLVPVASAEQGPRKWYQGSWKRPVYVATLAGRMLIPAPGEYRLAFKGPQPFYLLLRGELVFEAGARRRSDDEWVVSAPLTLDAGVLPYAVLTLVDREIRLRGGWQPPGADAVADLPATVLLTGGEPVALRLERFGETLHAGADYETGPAYVFHGCDTRFTPLTLRSLHAAWEGAAGVACRWTLDGRELGATPQCRVIVTNTGAIPVELAVTNAKGERAQARLTVQIPDAVAHEYRLATRLHGVPAIAYDDDPARPEIHLRGTAPDGLPFTLTAWVTAPDGSEQVVHEVVALHQGWTRLVLPVGTVNDLAAIRWTVGHAGVTIQHDEVRLLRQPFDRLPAATDGSFLLIDGAACALVPRRASSGHPPPFSGMRAGLRLVLLDGFLAPPGLGGDDAGAAFDRALLADLPVFGARIPGLAAESIRYRRQPIEDLAARSEIGALHRLAPLAGLDLAGPADIVVVAPDMHGPARGETLEAFERRLAGLVGLLRDALPAQVVLLTPPPGLLPAEMLPPSPGGSDPMRPYAEAVLRVADALGVTVADFYTLCHTREATASVVDGALTDAGRRLAAETLARTLVGTR